MFDPEMKLKIREVIEDYRREIMPVFINLSLKLKLLGKFDIHDYPEENELINQTEMELDHIYEESLS